MIHLDTSFLIGAADPGSACARSTRSWIERGEDLGISAIAWTEFACGPVDSPSADLLECLGEPIPFTAEDASVAALLFNIGGRRRRSLSDCMIAATAMRLRAVLATADGDFRRYQAAGLSIHES